MVGKRLVNTGGAGGAAAFDPLQNFETVTYTGNGGTQKITGYIRKGAAFNGSSSYVDLPLQSLFNPPTKPTVSVSLWFNVSSNGYLFVDYNGHTNLDININSSGYLVVNNYYGTSVTYTGSTDLRDNTWRHLVVTLDNTTSTPVRNIYLNGTQIETNQNCGTQAYTTSGQVGVSLGALTSPANTPLGGYLNGKIDQVRIFDKALSQNEVDTLEAETYDSSTKSTTDIFGDGSGIALYELDEDANDTGGVANGNFDGAAHFSGTSTSYIEASTSPMNGFAANSNYTVSLWFNADSFAAQYPSLINGLTGTSTLPPYLWCDGTKIRFHGYQYGDYTASFNTGQWYHVAMVNSGTTTSAYINGSPVTLTGLTTWGPSAGDALNIGGAKTSTTAFDGRIDQVRIYDTALSSGDITNLYNESNVPTTNLIAHYKLDGDATDETGNFNGTESNVSWGYDGTPTNVNFLGMAFQPDWVWIKARSGTYGSNPHRLEDSVRGSFYISTSSTAGEAAVGTGIQSYDTNGFTVGSGNSYNGSSTDYVAWCWKAGGAAVSNTDGSITSTVSANPDAGFSIVSYTGNGTAGATVGHGLSSAPEMVFFKNRTDTENWDGQIFGTIRMGINSTEANQGNNLVTFDSTIMNLTTSNRNNGSGDNMIAYCFHSVDGYQKVGSYTGDSGSDNQIDLGFQPRWVMIKLSSHSGQNWYIMDDQRENTSVEKSLSANSSAAEESLSNHLDFTSTGFTLTKSSTAFNQSGYTYIYLAIA